MILEVVSEHLVTTQAELVHLLNDKGVECTQASVSRDIRELGLVKRKGRYVPPDLPAVVSDVRELGIKVGGFLCSMTIVGDHLVVIRTLPGTADSIALYIDHASWPGVVGTIAGDDTIFIAVTSLAAGTRVLAELKAVQEAGKK